MRKFLTVVIYDATPLRYLNEPCAHRAVRVPLTDEQAEALALRNENEGYASAFIEEDHPAAPGGKP